MITRLSIQHYRSIENLDLQLGNVTVFVGQNGAGKTNIIDAIKFVRDAVKDGLDHAFTSRNGVQNVRQWSPYKPYNISINIEMRLDKPLYRGRGEYAFTISSTKESFAVTREELTWEGGRVSRGLIKHGTVVSPATYKFVREKGHVSMQLASNSENKEIVSGFDSSDELFLQTHEVINGETIAPHITDFESYTIFPNTLRRPQEQSNAANLLPHGENLSSILKRMRAKKRKEAIEEIIDGMRLIVPDLDNISTQALGGFIVPRFFVRPHGKKGHTFDVDQMSDGTLRILGLLVALYQEPGPAIIVLEEPELTVHPGALKLLADAIAEVGERKQILLTTHSPELLDHFEPEQIVAVEYEDGVTKAHPLNTVQKKAVKDDLFRLGELMSIEGLHG